MKEDISKLFATKVQEIRESKKTLPAFTDMSYEDLEIGNGIDASSQYLAFMQGFVEQPDELFNNLLEYCGQDTFAMVKLLDVLYSHI